LTFSILCVKQLHLKKTLKITGTEDYVTILTFPGIFFRKKKKKSVTICPGLGQGRVNFHQRLRGDTAGWADQNWPGKTGYSIPCAARLSSEWES